MPTRALSLILRAVLTLWLLCLGGWAAAAPVVINSALSVNGAEARFPETGSSQEVKLPDDWSQTRPKYDGPVWYRSSFDLPAGTWAEMNEAWDAWVVPGQAPARATVEAKLAGPGFNVEIMVEAAL